MITDFRDQPLMDRVDVGQTNCYLLQIWRRGGTQRSGQVEEAITHFKIGQYSVLCVKQCNSRQYCIFKQAVFPDWTILSSTFREGS